MKFKNILSLLISIIISGILVREGIVLPSNAAGYDENGEESDAVVTVDENGILTAND